VATATIEGIASMLLLILGVIGFGIVPLPNRSKLAILAVQLVHAFFALTGASIDQTGNFIYNTPVEICLCENGTTLNRDENILNLLPGTTYIEQDFTCFDKMGNPAKQLNLFAILGVLFIEYILLGYLLIALRSTIWKFKGNT